MTIRSEGARTTVLPRVHGRGDKRLDAVIDFMAFAVRPMPLATLLDGAPRKIAAIVDADVSSLYLLEGDGDELVMRGNVGFPDQALGQVRLSVGEGITGTAIECMRPISVASAGMHAEYRHFPGLGEERYPVFAAVPILGRGGALGALTVQRSGSIAFTEHDIELLVALAGAIAAAIRHAELLDSMRDRGDRKAGGGTRKVTLPGRPMVKGKALGAIAALRRPPARPHDDHSAAADRKARLVSAFRAGEESLRSLAVRATELGVETGFLDTYLQILSDARLRQRAAELIGQGAGVPEALGQVARDATRAAAQFSRDPFLDDRARDIEDLCDAIAMLATSDPRSMMPAKAVWVGEQITVFDLLVSAKAKPAALALTAREPAPRTSTLVGLLGVPALYDVAGLFRWASEGDIALIDASHGFLVVNPSRAEVAELRRDRKP